VFKNWPVVLLVIVPLYALAAWIRSEVPPPALPRVVESRQITHDGRVKTNIASDGSNLYFTELSGNDFVIAKVPSGGGDVAKFEIAFPSARLLDVSAAHSLLLAAENTTGPSSEYPFWMYPLGGGAPQRFGDLTGQEAVWAPDGRQVLLVKGSSLAGGTVESAKVLGGNPILAESALAAVKKWKYCLRRGRRPRPRRSNLIPRRRMN